MKTNIAQPLKQRRTLDTGERGKQQPSLHKLLQTHPIFGDSLPAPLVMKEYEISGITHIVQVDEKGSLINGKTICTVSQGDTVRINDSIRLRSRRGPNIEVYELLYKRGNPIYKWYAVEKLNDSHLPPGCFIREDTLRFGPIFKKPCILRIQN